MDSSKRQERAKEGKEKPLTMLKTCLETGANLCIRRFVASRVLALIG
jgi:hypothetical protein